MAAIVASELICRLSVGTGPGNSTASSGTTSLGGFVSSTALTAGLNTLFPDVTGAQNQAGYTDYRCVFVYNSNSANGYTSAVVYLSGGDPVGGAVVSIAVDTTAASALTSASAQADTIANGTTAPTAIGSWSAPTSAGAGLSLGTVGVGQVKAVWVRREVSGVTALSGEAIALAVSGNTGAL